MITGINHITFAVRNIDESFKFYADVLGFKPIQKCTTSVYLLAGNTWIALVKDQNSRYEHLHESTHIAFTVDHQDFEPMRERILKSGAKKWQENSTEGDSFYFVDPNGHKLEIHVSDLEARIKSGKKEWGDDVRWFV
ncbi:MAG: VOC family protein [Thermodesulfobacteriota bacterium]|nr:VOC family protein [Thermodesulfobacteriota bacterium]